MTINSAVITVVLPGGLKQTIRTRKDAPIATDAVAFAKWLVKAANELLVAAQASELRAHLEGQT